MSDLPELQSVANFREMGGLPAAEGSTVRHGQLFRSGHLATATDEDLASLEALGIRTIVDFRTTSDFAGDGGDGGHDRVPSGAAHVHLEMVDASGKGAEIREVLTSGEPHAIRERYGNGVGHELAAAGVAAMAVETDKTELYAQFLQTVAAAAARPVLWHCSAGKDRAGWAATLLGIVLGVPDEALVEHYLESNNGSGVQERLQFMADAGLADTGIEAFMMVHADFIRRGLWAVDEGWPTRQDYLTDMLGFGPAKVERLRNELLH